LQKKKEKKFEVLISIHNLNKIGITKCIITRVHILLKASNLRFSLNLQLLFITNLSIPAEKQQSNQWTVITYMSELNIFFLSKLSLFRLCVLTGNLDLLTMPKAVIKMESWGENAKVKWHSNCICDRKRRRGRRRFHSARI
jgi:hypothetical protein